jgi:hypothetical protein
MNVLRKLWWGLYPLPMTFWGYFVFGYFVGRLLLFFLALWIVKSLPQLRPILIIFGQCIDVTYLIIVSVGVWRSADAYKGASGWANLAKVAVVLWTGKWLYVFINGDGVKFMAAATSH